MGHEGRETEAPDGNVGVVGVGMILREYDVNTGELSRQTNSTEVSSAIGAMKSGNADGAKCGREANTSNEGGHEAQSSQVLVREWQLFSATRPFFF